MSAEHETYIHITIHMTKMGKCEMKYVTQHQYKDLSLIKVFIYRT